MHNYYFRATSSYVNFYIDGALKTYHTTYIPTEDLALVITTFTIEYAAKYLEVDYVASIQTV